MFSQEDPVREGGDELRSVFKCVRFNTYPMKLNACGVSVEATSDVESLNPEMGNALVTCTPVGGAGLAGISCRTGGAVNPSEPPQCTALRKETC